MSDKYRAPFLQDFCRRQWVSAEARETWEPRIARIGAQFAAAELASVETYMRTAALQNISPDQLPELSKRAAQKQLVAIPLGNQARPESYAASQAPIRPGEPWDYRVVITRIERAAEFIAAWGKDDDRVGKLLGYPKCCRDFYDRTWGAGSFDPTWYMTGDRDRGGPLEANVLLRWLGVRYIPHMPCSFDCRGSVEFGRQMRELTPLPERGWMDDLLSMPVLWSVVNSIGEVVTPIVTVNFRSDPAPERREIRREGPAYPEAGASGIGFPYRTGILHPPVSHEDEREWTDNGFSSAEAMERAHKTIEAVRPPINGGRAVLDLGCGNGLLARRLAGVKGRAQGVEIDKGRAGRAEDNLDWVGPYAIADISFGYDPVFPIDLVLLMPGRLLEGETTVDQAQRIIEDIRPMGELLVYAYGDTLKEYGTLGELCGLAGLEGELTEVQYYDGVAAGIWRFA